MGTSIESVLLSSPRFDAIVILFIQRNTSSRQICTTYDDSVRCLWLIISQELVIYHGPSITLLPEYEVNIFLWQPTAGTSTVQYDLNFNPFEFRKKKHINTTTKDELLNVILAK